MAHIPRLADEWSVPADEELAALLLVSDALDELARLGFILDNADLQPHLRRYFDRMKYLDTSINENKVLQID